MLAQNFDGVSVDFVDLRAAPLAPILQGTRKRVGPGKGLQHLVENPVDVALGIVGCDGRQPDDRYNRGPIQQRRLHRLVTRLSHHFEKAGEAGCVAERQIENG